MHSLSNKRITAIVNPLGAELSNLQFDGHEYLWHGDARYWSGRAPILFPIVGSLKNQQFIDVDKIYDLPRHGLARRSNFECISTTDHRLVMRLHATDETLESFPWNFELLVEFSLTETDIMINYKIANHDSRNMYFSLGSHPAFVLPIDDNTQLSDFNIHFDGDDVLQRFQLNEQGLLELEATTHTLNNGSINLSEQLFNDDALVFRDIKSKNISLRHRNNTRLSINTGDAPHVGIWSKPGAPFVCIEPWLGTSDFTDSDQKLVNKPDIIDLAAGNNFSHTIKISLHS